jgi:hypothetical protein
VVFVFGFAGLLSLVGAFKGFFLRSSDLLSITGYPQLNEKWEPQLETVEGIWTCHASLGEVKVGIPKPVHDRIAHLGPETSVEFVYWSVNSENVLHSIRVRSNGDFPSRSQY